MESAPSPVLDYWLINIMMSQKVYDLTKSQESKHQSSHLSASILSQTQLHSRESTIGSEREFL